MATIPLERNNYAVPRSDRTAGQAALRPPEDLTRIDVFLGGKIAPHPAVL
jgi:hypothetical protein